MDNYSLTKLCQCLTIIKLFPLKSELYLLCSYCTSALLSADRVCTSLIFPLPWPFSPYCNQPPLYFIFLINNFLQTSNDPRHSPYGYHQAVFTIFRCDVQKKGNSVHCLCTATDWPFPRVFCCEFKSHHQLSPLLLPTISTATKTGHKQACRENATQAPAALTCF